MYSGDGDDIGEDELVDDSMDDEESDVIDNALLEALLAQLGRDKWLMMSEKERQEKLLQLRLRERKLRREGWSFVIC